MKQHGSFTIQTPQQTHLFSSANNFMSFNRDGGSCRDYNHVAISPTSGIELLPRTTKP